MDESSRTVGAIIKLRKTFIEQGEQEIKKNIEPYVSKHLQDAYPRVHKGSTKGTHLVHSTGKIKHIVNFEIILFAGSCLVCIDR